MNNTAIFDVRKALLHIKRSCLEPRSLSQCKANFVRQERPIFVNWVPINEKKVWAKILVIGSGKM